MMKKIILLVLLGLLGATYWGYCGAESCNQWLSIGYVQAQADANPLAAGLGFFVGYVLVTALSLPFAALLTLMGGAVFGLGWGLLLVSFASSIGATLAFLLARTLLRDWVQGKFGSYLEAMNRGVAKDGANYLFSLRLLPLFPFFAINAVFGLTPMRTWTFYWVSQLGMLAGTAVYVNAGAELGAIEELSAKGVLTPGLLGAFVLLAAFPYILRGIMSRWQTYKLYRPFKKPKQFDNNLIVIGGGSAGLVSAYIAAAVNAKVTLIERDKMGGDCLNTGCVPSKALLRSAGVNASFQRAADFGLTLPPLKSAETVDFQAVMRRVKQVIADIEPHDSMERYEGLGVNCVTGDAKILSPWEVQVGEQVITGKNIIIAAGARPFVPPIPGIEQTGYLTSDTVWGLVEQPKRLMIMGAGPIGCELAQAFSRLGTEVTLVDMAERVMPREDADVAEHVSARFTAEGIRLLTSHKTVGFDVNAEGVKQAKLESLTGAHAVIEFDQLLVAVGRKARTEQFCDFDLPLTPQGTLQVDEYLRTPYPNIFACGDIVGPYQFTHMAAHQAWYAAVNALFRRFKKFKVDYRVVPWATFTDPEVARVGVSESEAEAQGLKYEVTRYGLDDLDRAIADGEAEGFVKVITQAGSDKILGVTITGYHASELIAEWVLAMKHGLGLNKMLGTIHIYPTLNEANKYAAGVWKRAHKPEGVLRWVERFHNWQRR